MSATVATQVLIGVSLFTAIILLLVFVILGARSRLVSSGNVAVVVNEDKELAMPVGTKLLQGLSDQGILIASACGGGGTCGQCKVQVMSGGGAILPTETSSISKREASEHFRLSCQVAVKQDMQVQVPDEVFGIRKYDCEVRLEQQCRQFHQGADRSAARWRGDRFPRRRLHPDRVPAA